MKFRLMGGLLTLGLVLNACSDQENRQPATALSAKSSDLPVYSPMEPRRVEQTGAYVHRWSGMTFPAMAGVLRRAAIVQFDRDGLDVSAEYRIVTTEGTAAVTVYIYPMTLLPPSPTVDESCREEFDGVKQTLSQRFPDAELIDEWSESAPHLSTVGTGHAAAYEITANLFGTTEALRSEAYLFCAVGKLWAVKYRASYSERLLGTSMVRDVIATAPAGAPQ
jgi:hypothetical protein